MLGQYNINESDINIVQIEGGHQAAIEALKAGEIDAMIYTSGELNKDPELRLIGFDEEFVKNLTIDMPYYSYKKYSDDFVPTYLIFIRAVLAVRSLNKFSGFTDEQVTQLTQTIYHNWYEIEKNADTTIDFFHKKLIARKVSLDLHPSARQFYEEQGLLVKFGWDYALPFGLLTALVIVIIIHQWGMTWGWVGWFLRLRWVQELNHQRSFRRVWDCLMNYTTKYTWQVVWWIFLLFVFIDLLIIKSVEHSYAHLHDVENPFAGQDFFDLLHWLLTFAVTGFNQDIFPNHMLAKVSAVLIPIIAVLGAFWALISANIERNRLNERQRRGEMVPSLKDHILICGWNDRVPEVVENLLSRNTPNSEQARILIIADIEQDKPIEKHRLDERMVFFYRGISSSYTALEAANVRKSRCALVMADDQKVKAGNFRSIFTVSAIRNLTKEHNPNYPIISEVYYKENTPYFVNQGVDRLVCLQSYRLRLLNHALLNPGVSDLLLNFLSFEPPFQLALENASALGIDNKNYRKTAQELRKKGVLLLSCYKKSKGVSHEAIEMNFRKDDCPYVVNPCHSEDCSVICAEDQLIIVRNLVGLSAKNENHLLNDTLLPLDEKKEKILIIGFDDIAAKLVEQLKCCSQNVVLLSLNEALVEYSIACGEKESPFRGNYNDAFENPDLELKRYDRIMIIAPTCNKQENQLNVYQDDNALKLVTVLKNYFSKAKCGRMPHIVSEIRDLDNKELFFNCGVNQIIPTNLMTELVLTRMAFHLGSVSGFIIKSMSYDEENQLARIVKWSVAHLTTVINEPLIGLKYDEIFTLCLPHGLQLLAIETVVNEQRQLIVNPWPSSKQAETGINSADSLYLILCKAHL